ncbi:glycosyltransferase family 39 protein [Roseimaritima sediminicola]|uniref:glycosyltransferase family 39 protein n=1 Tax=Roseimaritima sediminicola TaxID=2662066 RepID=UPI0012982532|nr:glycosyltransferase family 39 protein [Roseimaritima sediminicola]
MNDSPSTDGQPARPTRDCRPRLLGVVVAVVFVLYTLMLGWSAYRHSPIADEPAYLASGVSHWKHGHFELCKVSPPLVRLVAAIPVVLAGAELDQDAVPLHSRHRMEHLAGREFAKANSERAFWLFTLGRWACLPFAWLGAWICFSWGKQLYGAGAGLASLILWCFSPSVLAHAQMLNADVGVTALSLATCYLFWRWSRAPQLPLALAAGATLGLALLAKTNAIVLPPVIVLASLIHGYAQPQRQVVLRLRHLALAFLVSLYVINWGYGFAGSFTRLGDFRFFSKTFVGDASPGSQFRLNGPIWDSIPVPLPAPMVEGMDLQKVDFENSRGRIRTYLSGQWYDHSWWWYYLYVVAVKVPIGTWVLVITGSAIWAMGRTPGRLEVGCFVVLPAVALFLPACLQTGFGAGIRYVMPAFPFVFLLAGSVFCMRASKVWLGVGAAALVLGPIASLRTYPHSLCYFNVLAGGPNHGHFHLIDSNMEWGQNLLYVDEWVKSHADESPKVAQWSFYPIEDYGVEFTEPTIEEDKPIPPGTYLISVNYLRGNPDMRRMPLRRFLELVPDERIAYTTYVYHIPER